MPISKDGNPLLVKTVVVFGVVVSLCLISVSAVLNYRMGFHSGAGGLDGVVYGIGAASGDVLKAMSPFMGHWGRKNRDWLAVAAAVTMFVSLTAYSFTAAYGFSAIHRSELSALADKRIEDRAGMKAAFARTEARLDQLGPQRASGEVKAAIAAAYAEPVGKTTLEGATERCKAVRAWSRKACAAVKGLERELEASLEQEKLSSEAARLREELKGEAAAPEAGDPQREGIRTLLALANIEVSRETVGYGLGLLLAVLIELGSGLGLYLVTTPLRGKVSTQTMGVEMKQSLNPAYGDVQRGEVAEYVTNQVMIVEGEESGMDVLFKDYIGWCRRQNRHAVARAGFERAFQRFAQMAGVKSAHVNGNVVFNGIAVLGG